MDGLGVSIVVIVRRASVLLVWAVATALSGSWCSAPGFLVDLGAMVRKVGLTSRGMNEWTVAAMVCFWLHRRQMSQLSDLLLSCSA